MTILVENREAYAAWMALYTSCNTEKVTQKKNVKTCYMRSSQELNPWPFTTDVYDLTQSP
jgi:hypothetical protein